MSLRETFWQEKSNFLWNKEKSQNGRYDLWQSENIIFYQVIKQPSEAVDGFFKLIFDELNAKRGPLILLTFWFREQSKTVHQ